MDASPPRALPPQGLRLGSQLFINRDDSPATVQRFVRQMGAARLRLMRLFVLWDQVEPRAGDWQWAAYDAAFATAQECGIGVVPTLMSVSPPGWMRRSCGPQEVGPLEDPEFIARSEDYIRRTVERYRDSAALDSWILWNEPDRAVPRNAVTRREYVAFLRRQYRDDIAAYNRSSYQQFETFEQIVDAPEHLGASTAAFTSRVEELNWARFSVANVTTHLRRIAHVVRRLDPHHPIHLNPHRVSQCLLPTGQSLWAEAQIADFMGCSAHPVWHSTRFPRDRWHQSIAMFADLMRSCTRHPDELFWVSELQGGPTVYTGFAADGPRAAELRHWLWESVGAGARAIVYWCFNWRTEGYEAGEWSLLQQDGTPSERLAETTKVATMLDRHAALFQETRPPEPEVLILYAEDSLLMGMVDGMTDDVNTPRNRQMAADALCGAYLLAADLGREVRFVSESDLREHRAPASARVLLVPGCTALEPATVELLTAFARGGGLVIADHLIAWKTPDGAMNAAAAAPLRDVFGATLLDVRPRADAFAATGGHGSAPGWFFELSLGPVGPGEVLARWDDGAPAVVGTAVGAGRGVRIGTVFFQRYLSRPSPAHRAFLASLLPRSTAAVQLAQLDPAIRLRRLSHPRGTVAVLLNRGPEAEVELSVAADGRWGSLDGKSEPVAAGTAVRVSVPAGDVRLFLFEATAAAAARAASRAEPRRGVPVASNATL